MNLSYLLESVFLKSIFVRSLFAKVLLISISVCVIKPCRNSKCSEPAQGYQAICIPLLPKIIKKNGDGSSNSTSTN